MWEKIRRLFAEGRLSEEPTFTHIASAGFNQNLVMVGSSPFGTPVDSFDTFLAVPPRPTVPNLPAASSNRYLFRLCGWTIPEGHSARLIGIGEYTEIGFTQVQVGGGTYEVRRPVETPGWAFQDGNVSRGITLVRPPPSTSILSLQGGGLSESRNVYGVTPALLYQGPASIPYSPPGAGRFPGSPVPGLGLWRDLRFRWTFASAPLNYAVEGPGDLVYWASVRQTDPETRTTLQLDTPEQIDALTSEDRFIYRFPDAIYTRLGGFLVLEIGPTERFSLRRYLSPPPVT